jgi:hypothetical protein
MQVTLDSTEPLEKALSLVGALYRVEISVAPKVAAADAATSDSPAAKPARVRRSRAAKPAAAAAGSRRARGPRGKQPDPVAVRARANGHAVKDVGRVPAAVVAAYLESGEPTT